MTVILGTYWRGTGAEHDLMLKEISALTGVVVVPLDSGGEGAPPAATVFAPPRPLVLAELWRFRFSALDANRLGRGADFVLVTLGSAADPAEDGVRLSRFLMKPRFVPRRERPWSGAGAGVPLRVSSACGLAC